MKTKAELMMLANQQGLTLTFRDEPEEGREYHKERVFPLFFCIKKDLEKPLSPFNKISFF